MLSKEQQIKNSFVYFIPISVSSLLPYITLPVFTRILTKEDYGVLALAQLYAIFASGLANLGMGVTYDRNYFQYRNNRQEMAKLLYSILLFVVINSLLFGILTYLLRGILSGLIIGSAGHGNILFFAFCSQSFVNINYYYYLAYFKNSESAKSFVVYTIGSSLINFFISLFLVAYLHIGVIGLVYAQACSGVILFIILSYKFAGMLRPTVDKTIFCESLKIGYPLTPLIFLGVIRTQFDKYMIGLLGSIGGVGIYSIAQGISYMIFTLMTALQNVFSPQVYQRMFNLKEKGGEAIGNYLTPFFYVSIAGALLIALFSEEIITILTPKSYHGSIDIVIILSMFYGSLFFGKQPQLVFAKKTYLTSVLTVIGIILNVLLCIPFIIKWGAIGAAWATLLAGLISGAISFFVSQHYYEIKWEYRKIGIILLLFYISSLLIILLRHFTIVYEIRLLVKCMSILFYINLGVRFKIITMENYLLIKNMLPFRRAATSDQI